MAQPPETDPLRHKASARLDLEFPSSESCVTGFAPGRINLIGAHVDYNQGPVMPVPLARGTAVAFRPRDDQTVRLASDHDPSSTQEGAGGTIESSIGGAIGADLGWGVYPFAMAKAMLEAGHSIDGFDLAVCGDLPIGAGLSSSASLLVAVGRVMNEGYRLQLDEAEIALLAHRAETEFVGVSCGIMDPMASSLGKPGHALFLDCRDRSTELIPYDRESLRLMVIDSTTRRTLSNSHFNERVAECGAAVEAIEKSHPEITSLRDAAEAKLDLRSIAMPSNVRSRALHIVSDIHRVFDFRKALANNDLARCGALVTQCHVSLRDLFDASTPQLDLIVDAAIQVDGVLGARLTGAGWGGCVLALVRPGTEDRLEEAVCRSYRDRFGLNALCHRVS